MFEQEGKKLSYNMASRKYNVKKRIGLDDICHAIANCEQRVKQCLDLGEQSDNETEVKSSAGKSFGGVR